MAVFSYQAKTKDGKKLKGKIESVTKRDAMEELRSMDLVVFKVEPMNALLNKDITLRKTLKEKEFIIFLRQFATLLNAGILLVDSVELLAKQTTDSVLMVALETLASDVQNGEALSVAMTKQPKVFPDLLVHMTHSAEVSGRLEEVMDQMASYYEKQYRIKKKVETAMTYPLVVGTLAIGITIFLLVFIVPIFSDMFASMGGELPAITKLVLNLSNFFKDFWILMVLVVLLLVLASQRLLKQERYAYSKDVFV
uniref:type II secretion system F family protein n=1 Tax=Jeotgalibaca porci TaxID=1868793 RepID=UPI0035A158C5